MSASGNAEVRFVPKPWGHEIIWASTEHYVGKILHINAGQALSLQYHVHKDETIHVLRGRMLYRVGPEGQRAGGPEGAIREFEMKEGESYRNVPGTVHQMVAITDCDLLEASTPHLDDVVRLKDLYGREGTSAP
ncbi:MAG TPA: cupin [Gemmatimonadaceae bacterium]|nr:cupin [Gemmatimonadaceae bacterium]